MKVKISKYKDWVGPYQIADWFKPIFGEERIEKFTDGKMFEKISDWIQPACEWVEKYKPKRKEYVRIDDWDTWSMDHTLSLIIVPMLIQLKKTKHGAPFVDDADVPKKLRSSNSPKDKIVKDVDENWFARWEYILDEMIWAFTQIRNGDWEQQFHSGNSDWIETKTEENGAVYIEMEKGPNHTATFDKKGYKKYMKRIKRGTAFFGKYYFDLWD